MKTKEQKSHFRKLNTPGPGQYLLAAILGILALCCLLPVLLVVVASLIKKRTDINMEDTSSGRRSQLQYIFYTGG